MKVVDVCSHSTTELKRFMRQWVPASDGAEMICAALTVDFDVEVKAVVDERGIAGAISYTLYRDRVHVFSLGSIVKGAGSLLMDSIEMLADALKIPVTVNSSASAVGFYKKRGYKARRKQESTSVIWMTKK